MVVLPPERRQGIATQLINQNTLDAADAIEVLSAVYFGGQRWSDLVATTLATARRPGALAVAVADTVFRAPDAPFCGIDH